MQITHIKYIKWENKMSSTNIHENLQKATVPQELVPIVEISPIAVTNEALTSVSKDTPVTTKSFEDSVLDSFVAGTLIDGVATFVAAKNPFLSTIGATVGYTFREQCKIHLKTFELGYLTESLICGGFGGALKYAIGKATLNPITLLSGAFNNFLYEYYSLNFAEQSKNIAAADKANDNAIESIESAKSIALATGIETSEGIFKATANQVQKSGGIGAFSSTVYSDFAGGLGVGVIAVFAYPAFRDHLKAALASSPKYVANKMSNATTYLMENSSKFYSETVVPSGHKAYAAVIHFKNSAINSIGEFFSNSLIFAKDKAIGFYGAAEPAVFSSLESAGSAMSSAYGYGAQLVTSVQDKFTEYTPTMLEGLNIITILPNKITHYAETYFTSAPLVEDSAIIESH